MPWLYESPTVVNNEGTLNPETHVSTAFETIYHTKTGS